MGYSGEDYRSDMVKYAARRFDESQLNRMLNKTTGANRASNGYGEVLYGFVEFVIDWYVEGHDPETAHVKVLESNKFRLTSIDTVRPIRKGLFAVPPATIQPIH